MNVLFVSSEVFPFAKTGGLADVAGALPDALAKNGHTSSIILPFYKCVKDAGFSPELFKKLKGFNLYFLKHNGVSVYFVENDKYYNRDELYGTPQGDYPDNALRFGFFAKAVVASIPHIGDLDILHCNDWQSALIPLYIRLFHKKDAALNKLKIIFTIHNMAYQGLFGREFMARLSLPGKLFTPNGLEFWGRLNFMKAGIIYSDAITTVSKGYASEILTEEFGCGLDGLLRTREKDLHGIVNGVDYSVWNPATDKFIAKQYSGKNLEGKEECKKDVLKEFGIKYDKDQPLIGMITRLAEQKGIDIVADAMKEMLALGADFVLLGFGDEKYNSIFRSLAKEHKGHVGAKIDFDNALAHKIEAGSDMFLMPSRYEPCGLNQLYSFKYATVPVVRAVGGLDDTVENFDPITKKGTGFKFKDANRESLLAAVKNAVTIFKDKTLWNALQQNCLSQDYSWSSSAKKYEEFYNL
ncbi:MAG: glycogen synthase GlgA [Candidatus Omnitrophica bacterium]|nr:glycogen synthase GlgA [Candidatus Omnitrophota bacterium]MBU4589852.1 glycogen synthase GlgA [Candidatus Omnitrophota bacterium]